MKIGLIGELRDPGLVDYFVSILEPLRRDYIEDEAREWHKSLRKSSDERWAKTKELSMLRKFNEMNSCVPVTCTLPFDGGMWRRSCALLKSIRYFRETFLREVNDLAGHAGFEREQRVSEKIETVNMLLSHSGKGDDFRGNWSTNDIKEALGDFEIWDSDGEIYESPYVLVRKFRDQGSYIDIIN